MKNHIVCLGGGNAMPKAVLAGLKAKDVRLSVICAMLDSGGSSGRLRKDFDILSPGDIRRALITLANTSPVMKRFFNWRFEVGELAGHNVANLLIAGLELTTRDYEKTIGEVKKILNVEHEVLPVTLDNSDLYAVLEDGRVIKGETNIDKPKHDGNLKIERVYLEPKAKAYFKCLKAIRDADLVVIGPGDLYSTIAQILLVEGISEVILKSKAKKVYLCNLMTKYGETNDFTVLDFAKEIEKLLKGKLDYVIYNTKMPQKERISLTQKEYPSWLDMVKVNEDLDQRKFIGKDLMRKKGIIVHDSEKLAKVLISLI